MDVYSTEGGIFSTILQHCACPMLHIHSRLPVQFCGKLFRRHRFIIVIALYIVAAALFQEGNLALRLNPFGYRLDVQLAYHVQHLFYYNLFLFQILAFSKEQRIQLQRIDIQVLQHSKGRIPCSKVIHGT